jgi:transcription initiation factor TFIIF subunit beta
MSFATNTLPEEFQQEHGTVDLGAETSKEAEEASHQDEDLDLDRAGNRVWLCKVPRFLMDKWNEQAEQGAILGRVRVYDE